MTFEIVVVRMRNVIVVSIARGEYAERSVMDAGNVVDVGGGSSNNENHRNAPRNKNSLMPFVSDADGPHSRRNAM